MVADIGNELTNSIPRDGTAPPTANVPLGGFKFTGSGAATLTTDVPQYQQIQSGASVLLTAVAGTNTITANLATPTLTAYATGNAFRFVAAGTNTGATTLNINSIGAKTVQKDGSALVAGDIVSGRSYMVLYDGTNFQLFSGAGISAGSIQAQTYTAFTTGGTSSAFTLTPTPAITANAANQLFFIKLNAAPTGSPTLAVSGQAALNFKYYDSTGTKQFINSTVAPSGWTSDVYNDGTDWVMLDVIQTAFTPPVRQTVYNGTVDSNGFSSFGGSTGSTTVTASSTLYATAANGQLNVSGSIINPSWTGLSTNGTMYLYLDIASNGTCTTGSTTLVPTYRWGGADVTTNGQFTFNIQEMVGKVGNGSVATQTNRVFVGEVTVAAGVVSAITWYALMGRYLSPDQSIPAANTALSLNHNIGLVPKISAYLKNATTDLNYAVGDVIPFSASDNATVALTPSINRTSISIIGNSASPLAINNKTTGTRAAITQANWRYFFIAERNW